MSPFPLPYVGCRCLQPTGITFCRVSSLLRCQLGIPFCSTLGVVRSSFSSHSQTTLTLSVLVVDGSFGRILRCARARATVWFRFCIFAFARGGHVFCFKLFCGEMRFTLPRARARCTWRTLRAVRTHCALPFCMLHFLHAAFYRALHARTHACAYSMYIQLSF